MKPKPIPWKSLEIEEVYNYRWLHCPNYENCLSEMCKPTFLNSWSCIICDFAKGRLGQVQGIVNQLRGLECSIKS